ncbi:HSP20 family protein [Thermosporothrix hazakensis]|jgi:HSP20 family protein|uniref:HSP20 family protein n=2 Tax=Thermosporothrix TaxID=768650 RepID=A0A326U716_THEHA|nr:Hsp20/alpha crystallin family protein [Thermosporothrix hazakensis]PZW29248.1 HSP20 family protein [Thermosporothrix hazakensis]BBH86178.1 hypothetical protein KTC_09290 [Thermosporothrix sp. COM3]GCE45400.1 hypothetical protein KTH_02690 [Thermosporothrix hazakensis]
MKEQAGQQQIPVKVYRTAERVMIVAPMPGLEPDDISIEVTSQNHLILQGKLRGALKDNNEKELLIDEWSVGRYYRDLELIVPVDAQCANVTYGNGVVTVTLPVGSKTRPARLTLERMSATHGQHRGNAGRPPVCVRPEAASKQVH